MDPKTYSLSCLYGGTPPTFDFDDLLDGVMLDKRLTSHEIQVLTRQDGRLLSIDFGQKFVIDVTIRYERIPSETFAIALQGAKATAVHNNFGTLVAEHKSHIVISAKAEAAQVENTNARRLRLYALQLVTEFLYHFEKPTLLYSDLAQSLTLPAQSPLSYRGGLDSRIFEQAVLSARGGAVGSGAPIGAFVWGADELVGRPVIFKPVGFPSWAVTDGATHFFTHCDQFGVPEHDAMITDANDQATYHVEHFAPAANYPHGRLEVTVMRNLQVNARNSDGFLLRPELLGEGQEPRQIIPKQHPKPITEPASRQAKSMAEPVQQRGNPLAQPIPRLERPAPIESTTESKVFSIGLFVGITAISAVLLVYLRDFILR